ncbi:MAG: ribokinase [Alicyclobacillus sp.]|nr:ribokinase [Alicyclobacillus sp.]
MPDIIVVGSINMDVVNRVHSHPRPGETVHGLGTEYNPGGKGANQAVAAARAGGQVAMVAAVGEDAFGEALVASLRQSGVRTDGVVRKPGPSGMAFITVDAAGENTIILSQGANGRLTPDDLRAMEGVWGDADVILTQNEVPWETTRFVLEQAHRRGIRTVFNPAPAFAVPDDALSWVDVLVVNETEAEVVSGLPVSGTDSARAAAERLLARGAGAILVTLGEHGSLYVGRGGQTLYTPAFSVRVVDTTAAGDTFIGAFAAAGGAEDTLADALRFASAASAVAVTRQGAQVSIPERAEVEAFLARH